MMVVTLKTLLLLNLLLMIGIRCETRTYRFSPFIQPSKHTDDERSESEFSSVHIYHDDFCHRHSARLKRSTKYFPYILKKNTLSLRSLHSSFKREARVFLYLPIIFIIGFIIILFINHSLFINLVAIGWIYTTLSNLKFNCL